MSLWFGFILLFPRSLFEHHNDVKHLGSNLSGYSRCHFRNIVISGVGSVAYLQRKGCGDCYVLKK